MYFYFDLQKFNLNLNNAIEISNQIIPIYINGKNNYIFDKLNNHTNFDIVHTQKTNNNIDFNINKILYNSKNLINYMKIYLDYYDENNFYINNIPMMPNKEYFDYISFHYNGILSLNNNVTIYGKIFYERFKKLNIRFKLDQKQENISNILYDIYYYAHLFWHFLEFLKIE